MFAHLYPAETVGMVLVDSVHPEETRQFRERFNIPRWQSFLVRTAASIGLGRVFGMCSSSGACPDCAKFVRTVAEQAAGSYAESERQVEATRTLGKLPLAVLEHDFAVGLAGPRDDAFEAAWVQWQRDLAALSSDSTLQVVPGVGHEIQTDKPQMVIDAITAVLAKVTVARSSKTACVWAHRHPGTTDKCDQEGMKPAYSLPAKGSHRKPNVYVGL